MASWIKDKATLTYDRGNGTDKFFGRVMCTPYGDEGEFTEAPLSGTMTHHTGDVYVGTFHTERRHGFGKLTFKNEDVYVGTWAHGALVGEGTFKLSACGTHGTLPPSISRVVEEMGGAALTEPLTLRLDCLSVP